MKSWSKHFAFFILVICFYLNSNAQWEPCLGLDGGNTGFIIEADSNLFTTCRYSTFKTTNDFQSEWTKCPGANGGQMLLVDSVLFSHGLMISMLRSFDYGNTWELIPGGGFSETISMSSIGSTIFFDYSGILLKSENYMDSVETVTVFPDIDFMRTYSYDSLLMVYSIMGSNSIYRSVDTANTWDTISTSGLQSGNYQIVQGIVYFNDSIWCYSQRNIYCFLPDESGWIKITNGLPDDFIIVNMISCNSNLYCSTWKNGTFKLNLSDTTWHQINSSPNQASLSCVNNQIYGGTLTGPAKLDSLGKWHYNNKNIYHRDITSISALEDTIFIYAENELFRSDDDGFSFYHIPGINGQQIITTDTNFYSRSSTDILISSDYGYNWDTITGELEDNLYHLAITDDYYFVSTFDGFFRSKTDSIGWLGPDTLIGTYGIYYFEAIDSVVIVDGDPWDNAIWISNDYGHTYDTLFTNRGYIMKTDSRFYVLFDEEILYSDDLGNSWNSIDMGETYNISHDEATMISGSYSGPGGYINLSYDNGNNWYNITGNIPTENYPRFYNILFHNNRLLVSSDHNSLWYRDDILTNIDESKVLSQNSFNIYPVPVGNHLNIVSETVPLNCFFKVVNLMGQVCVEGKLYEQNLIINTSQLSPGVYIISFTSDNKFESKKFVKH
jgi:hypothetical protein